MILQSPLRYLLVITPPHIPFVPSATGGSDGQIRAHFSPWNAAKQQARRKCRPKVTYRLSPFLHQTNIYSRSLLLFSPHCKPVIGPISVCPHFDIPVAFPFNLNPPKLAHNAPAMFFPPVVSLSTFYLSCFHWSADVKIPRPDFPSTID